MKLRPVHRWKSFWLGVVVLGFLGWAWARSISRAYSMSYTDVAMSKAWEMNSRGGAIRYCDMDLSGNGSFTFDPSMNGWQFKSWERMKKYYWFPAGIEIHNEMEETTEVNVAYWLVVLGFAVAWCSMLGWRWWRMRRVVVCG